MQCVKCGRVVDENKKFCQYCGERIVVIEEPKNDAPAETMIAETSVATAEAAIVMPIMPKKKNTVKILKAVFAVFVAIALLLSSFLIGLYVSKDDVTEAFDAFSLTGKETNVNPLLNDDTYWVPSSFMVDGITWTLNWGKNTVEIYNIIQTTVYKFVIDFDDEGRILKVSDDGDLVLECFYNDNVLSTIVDEVFGNCKVSYDENNRISSIDVDDGFVNKKFIYTNPNQTVVVLEEPGETLPLATFNYDEVMPPVNMEVDLYGSVKMKMSFDDFGMLTAFDISNHYNEFGEMGVYTYQTTEDGYESVYSLYGESPCMISWTQGNETQEKVFYYALPVMFELLS